jgi:MoxR-like ATPase
MTTPNAGLVRTYGEIFETRKADGFLKAYNVERDEEIELLGLSLISGIDPLFLGDPGVGKTWMIELMLRTLELPAGTDLFSTLVFKETPADDILGPRSLPAMKAGKIERMMDGYLPTAVVAYLDEIFKASPTLVNSLLDLFANRVLKVGATVHECKQLLCIYGSSNELPDREDMLPFRDRFGLTKHVEAVRAPEGKKAVMRIQDDYQRSARTIDMSGAPTLSMKDVDKIRTEVRSIEIPDPVIEAMADAQDKWAGHGFAPSQRRVGQMLMALKARAWTQGREAVSTDDMIVCQHMAWNHPDHYDKAREVVMDFANAFARKAAQFKEALEPIFTEIDSIRGKINAGDNADDHMEEAFKQMRSLRQMRKRVREEIADGKAQAQDVTDLETVLAEVDRAHGYIEQTFVEDE